jgi:hypothetical protein
VADLKNQMGRPAHLIKQNKNNRTKDMARAQLKQHDENDPLAEARSALKIAIEERTTLEARAASMCDGAQRGDEQVASIDAELATLADLDDDIAEHTANSILKDVDFRMPPKFGDMLKRRTALLERRGQITLAVGKLHGELGQFTDSLARAEHNIIVATKPLMIAESDMLADEIQELEGKVLDARMRLSALSHAGLAGASGVAHLSARANAILRTPSHTYSMPQEKSAAGAVWTRYKAAFLAWRKELERDPDALPDLR